MTEKEMMDKFMQQMMERMKKEQETKVKNYKTTFLHIFKWKESA